MINASHSRYSTSSQTDDIIDFYLVAAAKGRIFNIIVLITDASFAAKHVLYHAHSNTHT